MTYRCSEDITLLNEKSPTVDMVGVYLQCPGLARGFNIISKILKNAPLQGIVLFIYLSFTKIHQSATYQYFCTFFSKCKTMYIIPCGFFLGGGGVNCCSFYQDPRSCNPLMTSHP